MSEAYFLAALFFVAGASALSDWREKRVPNGILVLGLAAVAAGLAVQAVDSLLGYQGRRLAELGEYYLPWSWYPKVAAHAALSATAGWTLWRLGIWPAGDAKLYIVLSLLLPMADRNLGGFPLLLFMVFLINVFVPAGVLFGAEGLARLVLWIPEAFPDDPRTALKAFGDRLRVRVGELARLRWQAAALVVNLAALFFLLRLAEERLAARPFGAFGHLVVFLALFVVWVRAAPLLRRPAAGLAALAVFCAGALAAALLGVDLAALLWRTTKSLVNFSVFITLARAAFEYRLERVSRETLPAPELRAGVILSEDALRRFSEEPEVAAILRDTPCDGLTEQQAAALRRWLEAKGRPELEVYRAVPFAFWILLGCALTLWRPGTVVPWLLEQGVRVARWVAAAAGAAGAAG